MWAMRTDLALVQGRVGGTELVTKPVYHFVLVSLIDSIHDMQSGCESRPWGWGLPIGEFLQRGWRGELLSGDRQNRGLTTSATRRKTER